MHKPRELCPSETGSRPGSKPTGGAKSSRTASKRQPAGQYAESSDDYPFVVATLDSNTRVIECAQGIQWIIQKRCKSKLRPWRSRYFCWTKEGLLFYARPIVPELLALPDHFVRRIDRIVENLTAPGENGPRADTDGRDLRPSRGQRFPLITSPGEARPLSAPGARSDAGASAALKSSDKWADWPPDEGAS